MLQKFLERINIWSRQGFRNKNLYSVKQSHRGRTLSSRVRYKLLVVFPKIYLAPYLKTEYKVKFVRKPYPENGNRLKSVRKLYPEKGNRVKSIRKS